MKFRKNLLSRPFAQFKTIFLFFVSFKRSNFSLYLFYNHYNLVLNLDLLLFLRCILSNKKIKADRTVILIRNFYFVRKFAKIITYDIQKVNLLSLPLN